MLLPLTHTISLLRIAVQPPRMATPMQRQNNFAITGVEARNRARGQTTLPFTPRDSRPTKLSTYRTIGAAWQEWMHGIGGNKPVKDWTPAEYRAQKSTYSRRKDLWDLMKKLVNAGIAPALVISKIEEHYGPIKSIRSVNDRIAKDVKNGTLPPALSIG
jgi:hypothetical protein